MAFLLMTHSKMIWVMVGIRFRRYSMLVMKSSASYGWFLSLPAMTHNTRLERTRYERASLVSCVGEPLKRGVLLHDAADLTSLRSVAASRTSACQVLTIPL